MPTGDAHVPEDQELASHYDPQAAAARLYPHWEALGYFKGNPEAPGPVYSVVIPPPNVTGSLHMGHALNNTLQDVLVRYRRMDGDNVVWIPGTDHASIAVHWVVERGLKAEGKSREDVGREGFLQRAAALKEEVQGRILGQQRALGISCDWSRTRFTLDPGLSAGVRAAFVRLYQDGLIYRAKRLVNWDPVSQTTLSDLEVIHEEGVKGELYHFAYPLAEGAGELVIATTRPETILGDTAVAVHPDDPRYQHLVGKRLRHPLQARTIPIIADAILVDPAFGTGAVKVTPAHDFNDFEVGERHGLERINILEPNAELNASCGSFAGMAVPAAREAIKAQLLDLGLERGRAPHRMNVGRSERSGAVVEPYLSEQWYVRARPLAAPALAAVEHGVTQFVPKSWENTYFSWLRGIRDWCISRQLWWGHRIPVWTCDACAQLHVEVEAPSLCTGCGHAQLTQDPDILDTWFSSALWPFSTMGWPEKTADLARYYPTAVLTTGPDIIFFWVARMMMFGNYFMGQAPFKDVYIHALIKDASGEKMSKTKGNVVNPLEMIERYGCDAFRFTLTAFAGQGREVRWDEARASGYHKFVNKIWQAFRFTLSHLEGTPAAPKGPLGVYERWLMARLSETVGEVRSALDTYRFSDAAAAIYHFVWNQLCDWYIEIAKATLYDAKATPEAQAKVRYALWCAFDCVARLVHPIMPFLSETLWSHLPGRSGSVMCAAYPQVADYPADAQARAEFDAVARVVVALRRIRAEFRIPPKQEISAQLEAPQAEHTLLMRHAPVVRLLARAALQVQAKGAQQGMAFEALGPVLLRVPLAGLVDLDAERSRLERELERCTGEQKRVEAQLGRADFVARAPAEVVAEKEAQRIAARERGARLREALVAL